MSDDLKQVGERYIAMAVLAGVRLEERPSATDHGTAWSVWLPATAAGCAPDSWGWWTRARAAVWALHELGIISGDEKLIRLDQAKDSYLPKDLHV